MEREIREFISYLHNKKRKTYNTEVSYQRDLKKMSAFLMERGIQTLSEVTPEDLAAYMEYMEQKQFAASSISRSVVSIRALFQFHRMEGTIERDPSADLKAPKIQRKNPEILTAEELTRLLKAPDRSTYKGLRDSAMLELLSATGLRVSELIHLELRDVHLRRGEIICRESGHVRHIPIPLLCQRVLSRYLSDGRDYFVKDPEQTMLFPNCFGKPMSRQGFWKVLKSYAEEAGIQKDITPHTLRHSLAVQLLQQGADLYEVKEVLGHSDVSTIQVYLSMQA